MKFATEISLLTSKCIRDRSGRSLYSEYVNSFARRQHLFDIAAKPIDADSEALLHCPRSYINQNEII